MLATDSDRVGVDWATRDVASPHDRLPDRQTHLVRRAAHRRQAVIEQMGSHVDRTQMPLATGLDFDQIALLEGSLTLRSCGTSDPADRHARRCLATREVAPLVFGDGT